MPPQLLCTLLDFCIKKTTFIVLLKLCVYVYVLWAQYFVIRLKCPELLRFGRFFNFC